MNQGQVYGVLTVRILVHCTDARPKMIRVHTIQCTDDTAYNIAGKFRENNPALKDAEYSFHPEIQRIWLD